MITVTASEFKTNFGKYLKLSLKDDIFVTKHGKIVGKYTNTNTSAVDMISGVLEGKLPNDYSAKDIMKDRLLDKYEIDD